MLFDPATVFLRRLGVGETEVLRGIYAAVRDHNWGTVPPRLENLQVESRPDSFRLRFDVDCRSGEIHFTWQGEIVGTSEGTVTFRCDGVARSGFLRNRIGFCVLHPLMGCAGQPCSVEHADGSIEHGKFPHHVSPHQPFRQLRALTHEPVPGLQVTVAFDGDVFETEDQRNWTDASFKTYCTPLALPFPVRVEAGTRIHQSVTVRLRQARQGRASVSLALEKRATCPALRVTAPGHPLHLMPPLGLCLASHGQPLSSTEEARLRMLRLSHLRADLVLSRPTWRDTLQRATCEAAALDSRLHLALHLTERAETELSELAAAVTQLRSPVCLWLVFSEGQAFTPPELVPLTQRALSKLGPIPIAAGTNANFAELNRNRLSPETPPLPCFSINPQVHAFDNLSLIENLEAQPQTVESAWEFARQPVVVSPITLRPRFNAVATDEGRPPGPGELPPQVDPRQMALFGAAWTLGSIAALSQIGHIHSLTYYETTGWRGVMESETGSSRPREFPSVPGTVFPLFHVVAWLAGFAQTAPVPSPDPQQLAGLALFGDQRQRRILLANLTGAAVSLELRLQAHTVRLTLLDETNVEHAMLHPEQFHALSGERLACPDGVASLTLKPHALGRLDSEP